MKQTKFNMLYESILSELNDLHELETEIEKQYKSLDFTKFVCAILIIVLHTAPFSSYSKVLTFGLRNIVTIIAVPFFFASSGFVLFKFSIVYSKNAILCKATVVLPEPATP